MYGYIYLTTNLVNRKMYVGQKKSTRFNPKYKGSGKILCRAFEKYGWDNFKVELLKECDSLEDLNQSEIDEIRRRDACRSSQYYNIAAGGQGWSSHWDTPGYREKMAEKFTGEGNPFYGKSHSQDSINKARRSRRYKYENDPEYRQRLSDAQKGKKASQETKDKMSKSVSKGKKGKYPFNNGTKVIYRDLSETDKLLEEGFVRGDLPRRSRTPEEVERMKKAVSGLICVTNEVTHKRVRPEEVQYYLDMGWRKGRPRRYVWINNPEEERYILTKDLNGYLSSGWMKGRKNKS